MFCQLHNLRSFLFLFVLTLITSNGQAVLAANLGDVVINEVAWMGTRANTSHQWIELYNTTNQEISLEGWWLITSPQGPRIELTRCGLLENEPCVIAPNGYFLLESPDDNTVSDIPANKLFNGTLDPYGSALTLWDGHPQRDESNFIDSSNISAGTWQGGDRRTRRSMERINPLEEDIPSNWGTFCSETPVPDPKDFHGKMIFGSPGGKNSLSPAEASFEVQPTKPRVNQEIQFTANPENCVIVRYEWDLDGDGLPDHEGRQPSRLYPVAGKYTIILWVTDTWNNRIKGERVITVYDAPRANFEALFPTFPPTRNLIQFVNTSFDHDGKVTKCQWDFAVDDVSKSYLREDQRTSALCAPRPVTYEGFPDSGVALKVSLTVTDNDGFSDSVTYDISIPDRVKHAPRAEFQALFNEYPPERNVVQFVNHSSDIDGEILSCHWNFAADELSGKFLPEDKRTSDSCLPPPVTYQLPEIIRKTSFEPEPIDPDQTPPAKFTIGDIFVAVADSKVQWRISDGTLHTVLIGSITEGCDDCETAGMVFDSEDNLYVTEFDGGTISKFDSEGKLLGTFGDGYSGRPESVLIDASGNFFVGAVDGDNDIRKFDSTGNLIARFDVAIDDRGSDWIDLDADQCTMFYTSEGKSIKRFDVCKDKQLPDFVKGKLNGPAYALRLLSSGGLLVADSVNIKRLDSAGNIIQTYDAPDEDLWFALNLDPDGTSFWSADITTSNVYKFDIESGEVLLSFNAGPETEVGGLAVLGEITIATSTIKIRASLTVTDNDGLTNTIEQIITFPDPVMQAPQAEFQALFHEYPPNRHIVQFVSHSSDPDGRIVSCQWNFASDETSKQYLSEDSRTSDSCIPASVTYENLPDEEISIRVSLTVTDNHGLTDTVEQIVTFPDPIRQTPQAEFQALFHKYPPVRNVVQFVNHSSDPDGRIVSCQWDFAADEASKKYLDAMLRTSDSCEPPPVTYKNLPDEGAFVKASLTVIDNDGLSDSSTQVITFPTPVRHCRPPMKSCESKTRSPQDIVLLVDMSGTMDTANLKLVMHELIRQLDRLIHPQSRIGLITYNFGAIVDPAPLAPLSEWTNQHDRLLNWIHQPLVTESISTLETGLLESIEYLSSHSRPDAAKHVLVITKGPPLPSIDDPQLIIDRANIADVAIRGLGIIGKIWDEYDYNALKMIAQGTGQELVFYDERAPESLSKVISCELLQPYNSCT